MIGTALCDLLNKLGAAVAVLDPREPKLRDVFWNEAKAEVLTARMISPYDIVFNLGAKVAGVEYNRQHPLEMFAENLSALIPPVKAAKEADTPHFLQVSSVCIYAEEFQAMGCDESLGHRGEPHPANAGYALAKRIGERALEWAGLKHAVIVRPANTYGIGDHFDWNSSHVIPSLIRKAFEQDEILGLGTGEEIREFIYVDDTARGMLAAMEFGQHTQAYNIGANGAMQVSIRDLTKRILSIAGMPDKKFDFIGELRSDRMRWVRSEKLQALGWRPEVGLQEGLQRTIEWYRSNTAEAIRE